MSPLASLERRSLYIFDNSFLHLNMYPTQKLGYYFLVKFEIEAALKTAYIVSLSSRDVAQSGRALGWGSRGRRFKSCRPDIQNLHIAFIAVWRFFCLPL